jgi:hypothetical protein
MKIKIINRMKMRKMKKRKKLLLKMMKINQKRKIKI